MNPGAKPIQLSSLHPHIPARIHQLTDQNPISSRLAALGLLPGSIVSITHIAPLGDPIAIQIEKRQIALRRSEAQLLLVQPQLDD
ncbi:MAG: ferrous iron transport protein A [Chthoniobacterales bacterium]|nr:ferrous iron transport protein A [Chthoniobacterales bacterium]